MSNVIVTDQKQLEQIISGKLTDVLKEQVPDIVRKATEKPWLTKEELIELTGWSSRTIQNLRSTNQIPYSKHGRKILYPREGIMDWLEENKITPRQ